MPLATFVPDSCCYIIFNWLQQEWNSTTLLMQSVDRWSIKKRTIRRNIKPLPFPRMEDLQIFKSVSKDFEQFLTIFFKKNSFFKENNDQIKFSNFSLFCKIVFLKFMFKSFFVWSKLSHDKSVTWTVLNNLIKVMFNGIFWTYLYPSSSVAMIGRYDR